MREIDRRYSDSDVVLISVHTPEFDREKEIPRVEEALARYDLGFPVVIDNDWAIWRAFDNHYWPALYLIDKHGVIRDHHRGELHEGSRSWERWIAAVERLRAEPGPDDDLGAAAQPEA